MEQRKKKDEGNNGERDLESIIQRKNRGNFGVFQNNMREREREGEGEGEGEIGDLKYLFVM